MKSINLDRMSIRSRKSFSNLSSNPAATIIREVEKEVDFFLHSDNEPGIDLDPRKGMISLNGENSRALTGTLDDHFNLRATTPYGAGVKCFLRHIEPDGSTSHSVARFDRDYRGDPGFIELAKTDRYGKGTFYQGTGREGMDFKGANFFESVLP